MMQSIKVLAAFPVAFALTMAGGGTTEVTTGTIRTVDSSRNVVVLKGLVKDSAYSLTTDTWIFLDGVKAKLGDLRESDKAAVVYSQKGESMIAKEVRGLRNAEETTGTVRDVFKDKNEITLKGLVKDTTYELTKDATIWLNGKKASLSDLRAGDEVMITHQKRGDHNMAADVRIYRK